MCGNFNFIQESFWRHHQRKSAGGISRTCRWSRSSLIVLLRITHTCVKTLLLLYYAAPVLRCAEFRFRFRRIIFGDICFWWLRRSESRAWGWETGVGSPARIPPRGRNGTNCHFLELRWNQRMRNKRCFIPLSEVESALPKDWGEADVLKNRACCAF